MVKSEHIANLLFNHSDRVFCTYNMLPVLQQLASPVQGGYGGTAPAHRALGRLAEQLPLRIWLLLLPEGWLLLLDSIMKN